MTARIVGPYRGCIVVRPDLRISGAEADQRLADVLTNKAKSHVLVHGRSVAAP